MSDQIKEGKQATPNDSLEDQITSSVFPKNEREWWAHHEIEALRAENAAQALLIASLKEERDNLRRKIFTNTTGELTLDNRFFTIEGPDFILDNNFDFDAGFNVSGDFGGDDKRHDYMQMICDALNSHSDTQRQNAELRQDNEQAYISLSIEGVRPNSLREGIAELMQRVGAAEKDAERYRWLRNNSYGQFEHPIVVTQHRNEESLRYMGPVIAHELDRITDAAIAASKVSNESAGKP
jgi:hypothetical protein